MRAGREQLQRTGAAGDIPDPIFAKDCAHRWIAFNDAFCRLLGLSRAVLLGASDPDFFPAAQVEVFWRMDDVVFSSGEGNENEETVTGAGGVERTIWTRKFPLRDAAEAVSGLVGVITDVTTLKERVRAVERFERENAEHRLVIAAQAEMLARLTMPVVEVGERILLVPLVGALGQGRVALATEDLLTSIGRVRARFVLFDLTGVPTVDTDAARDLLGMCPRGRAGSGGGGGAAGSAGRSGGAGFVAHSPDTSSSRRSWNASDAT